MLGKKKSVDDGFSDLWESAKIILANTNTCKHVIQTCLHQMGYSPSEDIWPLRLGVNPDVL